MIQPASSLTPLWEAREGRGQKHNGESFLALPMTCPLASGVLGLKAQWKHQGSFEIC